VADAPPYRSLVISFRTEITDRSLLFLFFLLSSQFDLIGTFLLSLFLFCPH